MLFETIPQFGQSNKALRQNPWLFDAV